MDGLDTSIWLYDAITEASERDDTTRGVQEKKLLKEVFTRWKNTSYLSRMLLPPKRNKETKPRPMTRVEVAKCAAVLGVNNPYDDMPEPLPAGLAAYPLYGEVEYGNFRVPGLDKVQRSPIISTRHPLYPKARPMAWLIKDDALGKKGYVVGAVAYGVNFQDTGAGLKDGNIIVLERIQDGKFASSVERVIGIVKLIDDGIEIQTRSSDQKYAPIHIKESEIKAATSVKIRTLICGAQIPD